MSDGVKVESFSPDGWYVCRLYGHDHTIGLCRCGVSEVMFEWCAPCLSWECEHMDEEDKTRIRAALHARAEWQDVLKARDVQLKAVRW